MPIQGTSPYLLLAVIMAYVVQDRSIQLQFELVDLKLNKARNGLILDERTGVTDL